MSKTLNEMQTGSFLTRNRQRWAARFCLLALLLTLNLTSFKMTASAQTCVEQCQQAYQSCLLMFPEDPGHCDDRYDSCLVGCM
jgi:hypothetical protein